MLKHLFPIVGAIICLSFIVYPYDGYNDTGIKRLKYVERVKNGELKSRSIKYGALRPLSSVQLNLGSCEVPRDTIMPPIDASLSADVEHLFKGLNKNYSLTILDMTDLDEIRYAEHRPSSQYQPGSVGKLVVLAAFFTALKEVYPDDFAKRKQLLKTKQITGGQWALYDHHTVPVYNEEQAKLHKRKVAANDVFTLYEWVDHMVSVSNNGAASVVWREALLMSIFKEDYPNLTYEEAQEYWKSHPRGELSEYAINYVNAPLRALGITKDEWRLGKFFTSGAGKFIPGRGGSIGTPIGLMKYVIALEEGNIVDKESSLEMKRLLYLTDRRIRYAAATVLDSAGVYFKSGSFYKCDRVKNPNCGNYQGNVYNYMNSVAIVEHMNGIKYAVCLMSNVLNKNSAYDHLILSTKIDKIIQGHYALPEE